MPPTSKKYYHDIDLDKNNLVNVKIQPISTANRLALGVGINDAGLLVFDTDLVNYFVWIGTEWKAIIGAPITPLPTTYVFVQNTPSSSWTIVHNLGFFPNVTVIDSSNSTVIGDITYIDNNSLTLSFTAGFSGTAYLS